MPVKQSFRNLRGLGHLAVKLSSAILLTRTRPDLTSRPVKLETHEPGKSVLHAPTPPLASPTSPRVSPLGYVDHSDFGERGVKLVYAEQPDKSLVRADCLEAGPRPPLICPLCRTPVHRCRSKKGVFFFRHQSGDDGCGGPETNAHLWAKQELLKAKRIKLPAAWSRYPGATERLQAERWFTFVDIEVEARRGDLIPDLVAKAVDSDGKVHELWIEIYVTHKCGAAKVAKIGARAQPTIEVDLSALRTSHDAPAIRDALLEEAERYWLCHKAIEADFEARTAADTAERERQEAERRQYVDKLVAAFRNARMTSPTSAHRASVGKMKGLGLSDVLGLGTPRSAFSVSDEIWQAVIWNDFIIKPMEQGRRTPTLTPANALSVLRAFLPPDLRDPIDKDAIKAAKALEPRFVAPQAAITDYFRSLDLTGDFWSLEPPEWHLAHPRAAALDKHFENRRLVVERTAALKIRVVTLLNQSPDKIRFNLSAWLHRPCLKGRSPLQLIDAGGDRWDELDSAVRELERMVSGRDPVDQLLGLPLEPLKQAADVRKAQAAAAAARHKAELAAQAAAERVSGLVDLATRTIGGRAESWLDEASPAGASYRDLAAQSSDGLEKARNALWKRVDELNAAVERARRLAANQEELERRASKFYDGERLRLFLTSSRHELGRRAPRDVVVDDAGLRAALALLPSKPERRGH
jgi:hypothetical protein